MDGKQYAFHYLKTLAKTNLTSFDNVVGMIDSEVDNVEYLISIAENEPISRSDKQFLNDQLEVTKHVRNLSLNHHHKDDLLQAIEEYEMEVL